MKNLGISYTLKEQLKEVKSLHKFYNNESFEIKGDPVSSSRSCCLGHPIFRFESHIKKRQEIRSH